MARKPSIKQQTQPAMRMDGKAIDPYDARPLDGAWVSASVIPGEDASSRYNNNTGRDYELVLRATIGTPAHACSIITNVCSSQTLRLYRKVGRGAKSHKGRAVTDRRRLKYLRGDGAVMPTACKGANYASKAGDGIEEVMDSPVLSVLQNPDPVFVGQLWIKSLWWQLEACGRAYLWAGDRVNKVPTSLYILPSAYSWPVKSRTGLISEFVYARNRSDFFHAATEDTVYLRSMPNPLDPVGAMSWLQSVTAQADMEAAALTSEVKRWENGGQPGMVFKAGATTSNPQMEQLRAGIQNQIRGVGKAGAFLLLRDTELIQYATKPHEMQYIAGMDAAQKAIYDAAGVPEPIYRLNSANLASASVAEQLFFKLSIAPRLAVMASELTEGLLPLFGLEPGEYWFSYDNPVREDVVLLAAEMRAAELQGIITPNEYRAVMDLEALPDEANVLRFRQTEAPAPMFDPFSTTATAAEKDPATVAEPVAEPTDAKVDATAAAGDVQATALNGAQVQALADLATQVATGQLPKASAQALAAAAFPLVDAATLNAIFGPLESFTPEAPNEGNPPAPGSKSAGKADRACECASCGTRGQAAVKSADDTAAAGSDRGPEGVRVDGLRFNPQLKAFETEWDDDANVPKSTLRIFEDFATRMNTWYVATIPAMVNDSAGVDPPTVPQMEAFGKITDDFIGKVLTNGAAVNIAKLPGVTESTWNIANEPAMAYIRERGLELAKSVPDTMVGVVQSAIEKELAAGTTVDKIRDAIRAEAPQLSGYEAERLARTETTNAFVEGGRQAWVEAGVQKKRWLLAGGPCPECEAMAAKYPDEIPINEPFEMNGVSIQGPALHPNCRCDLAPGLEYDDDE
jgi:phage portal protein BeeE